MTDQPLCEMGCGKPSTVPLCHDCTTNLEHDLFDIGRLWPDLLDAVNGQLQLGTGGNGDDATGYSQRADELAQSVRLALLDAAGLDWYPDPDTGEPRVIYHWTGAWCTVDYRKLADDLIRHVSVLRHDVGHAMELRSLLRKMRHTVNRPAQKLELGVCTDDNCQKTGTTVWLRARPDQPVVQCGLCGTVYEVAERLDLLRRCAADVLATIPEIAKFTTVFGVDGGGEAAPAVHVAISVRKLTKHVEYWMKTGRLRSQGQVDNPAGGRPQKLFRVGSVQELLRESEQRKQRKESA